jgi:hypothetical protein
MGVFEKNPNWLATARYRNGLMVGVMRGVPGGEFAGNYYLYDEDWKPSHSGSGGMQPHSFAEIAALFASGELSLVRGQVPS